MRLQTKLTVATILLLGLTLYSQQGNSDYQYALIEAVKQKNLGNLSGAMELYNLVLEENDSVAVAHYEIGTLYAVTGNYEKAVNHLKRAHELDPDIKWYLDAYIDGLLVQEEFRKAKKVLKERIKRCFECKDQWYRLANVYFLAERSRKALKVLEKMEKRWGLSDKITLLKVNIYEDRGEFKKALDELEKIIEFVPESLEIRVVAAELALKSNDKDLAADYYEGVLELDSMNIYALTNLTDYYREKGELSRSFSYLNKSFESDEIDYERKIAILSFYFSDENLIREQEVAMRELIQTMIRKYKGKDEIHLIATDFFINRRDYNEALFAIKPLLKSNEKRYELWRQGILLANTTEEYEEMLVIGDKGCKIFPDSIELYYFKGIAEWELGEYEKLINTFSNERILKANDRDMASQMRMMVAESYYQLEQHDKSDSIFRSIIRNEPVNYLVLNNFSYYLSIRGECLAEAEEYSRIAIMNNPENGTFLDTYAWVLYKSGDYEEAERYIMKALEHGGQNSPVINEHAGDIHWKMGSTELARKYYQKAIILGGDKNNLIRKLEKLSEVYEE
ncbi:MAG: tetratricopeptide repeat protein [Bacteroidales bacterium]